MKYNADSLCKICAWNISQEINFKNKNWFDWSFFKCWFRQLTTSPRFIVFNFLMTWNLAICNYTKLPRFLFGDDIKQQNQNIAIIYILHDYITANTHDKFNIKGKNGAKLYQNEIFNDYQQMFCLDWNQDTV